MKIKGRDTKPLSKEDREVFDWIGQKLQDIHDGKNVYLTDEEVEQDRQAWLKTQTTSEKSQEPIVNEDKDEDEVGEEPDPEEEALDEKAD